jgi:L-alanine-DL-glutamate epimerase-like enolase superfamily enzyme
VKITDVQVVSFPLEPRAKPRWNSIIRGSGSRGGSFSRLEIHTDEGLVGAALGGSRAIAEGPLRAAVLGEDPLNTERLWDKMYMGGWRKPVAKGDAIAAMSRIDIALWDLKGKILGRPVWQILGGHRDRVPAYAAGGYYEEGKGPAELAAEMEHFVSLGYRAVKMKVGWSGMTLRQDAARVGAVRAAVGPDVDVMVDANNAWDAVTAIRFARLVEQYEPYWFEEPVRADDFRGGAQVAAALDMPVASGENEFTRWGFRDLIEQKAADIIQADPGVCGGVSEWIKIAHLADAYHLKMAPHGGGHDHVLAQCVAAVSNGLIVESQPTLRAYLHEFVAPVQFSDGYITLSREPGLGFEWNEQAIRARQRR